jgi:hypothetical protein
MEDRAIKVGAILAEVENERQRQIQKWGHLERRVEAPCESRAPLEWKAAVLGEEFGEVCKAVVEGDREGLKTELYHVAAVCVAWLESL